MIWKGWIPTLALIVLASAWSGCAGLEGAKEYVCVDDEIRVGDTLIVSLFDIGQTDITDKAFVVRNDGTINVHLLGSVAAAGKKFGHLEKELETAYIRSNFYKRVTVSVKPSERFYTVGGQVNSPTRMLYLGQTTVLRAIASCGDFTEFANQRKVEIIRANGTREIMDCKKAREKPKELDRPICPGDAIFVPRSL